MRIPFAKQVTWYLVFAMFILGITPRLDASMSPSDFVAASKIDRAADLQQIQRVLEMKMVRDRLEKFGFTSEEIQSRFNALSDHQVHQLAQQIDDLRVGSDEAVAVIIILLVIAILVIILLKVSGRKVVVVK